GQDSTIPVRLEHVIYHCQAVSRGLRRAHLVADLPFMTYYDPSVALPNAARLMAEGGAHAVKLEGGREVCGVVEALVAQGVPVMGHIGLTPQSVHAMGGHKIQGRGNQARERLLADAQALQDAGVYCIVLEGIPAELAAEISASLQIPTIGIGAGAGCDGQILVLYDLLGLNDDFAPKFLKKYAELGAVVREALVAYGDEVRQRTFPSEEHSYTDATRTSRNNLKAVGQ
ncbi:MAG TPA: 3-methyl-2-oxobutanoate hydroxymethyltransferase, partial [Myxococcales bacterium]|nr:3-methyl-2-oxobutanoate hydroxymethyltransferase [Myxococcales bacterium]